MNTMNTDFYIDGVLFEGIWRLDSTGQRGRYMFNTSEGYGFGFEPVCQVQIDEVIRDVPSGFPAVIKVSRVTEPKK